jgi:predicted dehydrogenase
MPSGPEPKINIAVQGFGLIGPRHAEAVLKNEDTKLVGIVDPLPQTVAKASALGVPCFSSLAEMIQSTVHVDAVIICTPNHTHAACARELSAAGISMLIEKPFCSDTADGKRLIEELREAEFKNGVKTLVGHHRRFNPYVVSVKQAIEAGSLGKIVGVNGLWTLRKPQDYFDPEWRRQKTAGPVLINLVHDVDLFHHFFGPITRVHAEGTIEQRGFEAEEGAAVTLRFKSGCVGTCFLSDNTPSPYSFEAGTGENPMIPAHGQDFYRIFGSQATLSVPDMTIWSYNGQKVKDWSGSLSQQKLAVEAAIPFDLQLAHFVRMLRGLEPPNCTAQAGLAALVVCEAIKKSLELRQPIELEPYEL